MKTINLLVVEDNPGDVKMVCQALNDVEHKFVVDVCDSLKDCISHLNTKSYETILLDLNLPDSTGISTFRTIYAVAKNTPIVIITGVEDAELGERAVKEGAQDYLEKRFLDGRNLVRCILYAIARHEHRKIQTEAIREIMSHLQNISKTVEAIISQD